MINNVEVYMNGFKYISVRFLEMCKSMVSKWFHILKIMPSLRPIDETNRL